MGSETSKQPFLPVHWCFAELFKGKVPSDGKTKKTQVPSDGKTKLLVHWCFAELFKGKVPSDGKTKL